MNNEKIMEVIMGIITHSGDAKSHAMKAIKAAREGDFEKADDSIKQAERAFVKAHHSQTALLTKEAQGEKTEVSLLMVHAQDHLMTSMTFTDLAKEIILLHQK
ncbi:PTS mannose transporter subunit IIA [Halolactibacillus alkaliphilus]|uniref:PTS mannose transporter subunit IIA n=1 Tax=Halolactibacillus alkaliphilus TaxID=442899 RepID=A0A511X0A4_9BACI|nr:PTS lactose/cellobiose transporter subunit IIA [Halolactibacillus alkaliphilus]GEN56365.1 PTS mannose transporter subunit IIA [Halolactibacillus alkaliphilus]GGN67509.1 PTS mannose transporter subunit IIA [Halolactibacillus alkaliphilus]SFO91861.1 PTS system, cellobiose-specific IIA component [Halolactibacillus alkaliphilus]